MVYTAKLNNSILGWTLLPKHDEAKKILEMLYWLEKPWDETKPSDKAFSSGEPVEKVIAYLKEVCKGMGVKVSFCGNLKTPTVRMWYTPEPTFMPNKVSVDLKWSCWTTDKGIWDEYAPGVWEQMERAFKGETVPLQISTGPRKEIRYGWLTISKGNAEGYFCTEWDSVEDLADTLGATDENGHWKLPEDKEEFYGYRLECKGCGKPVSLDWKTVDDEIGCGPTVDFLSCEECGHYEELTEAQVRERMQVIWDSQEEAFREMIPHSYHNMEPGMDWDFSVKARSFRKLMERIDKEEDALLARDREEWESIAACFRKK